MVLYPSAVREMSRRRNKNLDESAETSDTPSELEGEQNPCGEDKRRVPRALEMFR
jgi:hypothetical protein